MGTTLEEQFDRLDEAREADLDILCRMPAHCSLPRVDRAERSHFVRQKRPFDLVMGAGVQETLPCENLPRLLPARVCDEAVHTGQRNLIPGKRLSGFMDQLVIYSTSGYGRRRPREQMKRLLSCATSLHCRGGDKSVRLARACTAPPSESGSSSAPRPRRSSPVESRTPAPCVLCLHCPALLLSR